MEVSDFEESDSDLHENELEWVTYVDQDTISSTDLYFSDDSMQSVGSFMDDVFDLEEGYNSEEDDAAMEFIGSDDEHNQEEDSDSRSGSRNDNAALVPPSRISSSGSDTYVHSDSEISEEDEETDLENFPNPVLIPPVLPNDIPLVLPASDNVEENANNSLEHNAVVEIPFPDPDHAELPDDENVEQEQETEEEQHADTDAVSSENRILRTPNRQRRRPLSEISSELIDQIEKTITEELVETRKAKKKKLAPDLSDDDDDGMTCSVCLDAMTNSGTHRLVSLGCGHLFGKNCVERWLKSGCVSGARRCPTCNKKASLRDVRPIYARKLRALDTAERDRIQMELDKVKQEKTRLEFDFTRVKLNCEMQKQLIKSLKDQLKNSSSLPQQSEKSQSILTSVSLVNKLLINKDGGCRVLGCSSNGIIVVSQKSPTPYFFAYGICVIRAVDQKPVSARLDFHCNVIRDVAFNLNDSNEILTVSLDRTAKLTDIHNNKCIQTFNGNNSLWSCAWDSTNPYQIITGSQNGIVTIYDRRNTSESVYFYSTLDDSTPIISLASISPTKDSAMDNGGIISCRLNSVYAYNNNDKSNSLVMSDGPFISLNYNRDSKLLLFSTRPSLRFPATRHLLSELASSGEESLMKEKHIFTGGTSSQLMSRSCQMLMSDGDVWVGAHNESLHAVQLLSVKQNGPIHSIPCAERILDLCPFMINNSLFLGSLSDKTFYVHKFC